ncbi:MAG: hypothetical protein GY867_12530 [bacterium]|nr:hypothetical protein [bacterium]
MTRHNRQSIKFTAAAVLFAALVAFTGCSRSPVSTTEAETPEPQVLSRSVNLVPGGPQLSPLNLYAEQVVSAEQGGRLELVDVVLDIPPHAVDNDTLFSIFIPTLDEFYNEFGTHGLVFNVPVTVTMSYRSADLTGVDESSIRIGWFNESSGTWQDMVCEVDPINKIVTGQLNHFSAYALVSD